jgi:hypothetical protein
VHCKKKLAILLGTGKSLTGDGKIVNLFIQCVLKICIFTCLSILFSTCVPALYSTYSQNTVSHRSCTLSSYSHAFL